VSEPVIIEAAINGATPKTVNPNVPVTGDEIVVDALACFEAGRPLANRSLLMPQKNVRQGKQRQRFR
jgi:3-keto-5-aminohexanoate cleavage enzyme